MGNQKMSSSAWTTRNVVLPLVPFSLQALIRISTMLQTGKYSFFDFLTKGPDFPTLLVTLGFLCVLVYESLFKAGSPIENRRVRQDIKEEIALWASRFLIFSLVCFVFFTIIVVCDSFSLDKPSSTAEQLLNTFKALSALLFLVILGFARGVRESFKLRAEWI